jgi:hypothetical protein
MKSFWAQWASRDPIKFGELYLTNRQILGSVDRWITADSVASSLWRYGVPEELTLPQKCQGDRTGLSDIEREITCSDALVFVGSLLSNLRYLEIGVSVGKNFLQICNQFRSAEIVGLDVEEINPVLLERLGGGDVIWRAPAESDVATLSGQTVPKRASLTQIRSTEGSISYLSADQFSEETWRRLAGRKFNLVFSDGVHSADALQAELQFLLKYDLIDRREFVMLWDDLLGRQMQSAFVDCAKSLCQMFGKGDDAISMFRMHGTYGLSRPMGMFVSL